MSTTPLIFVSTCDVAAKLRGKAFPEDQLEKRLKRGVGWTPTNVMINCFDGIGDGPFGSLGDLLLIPDPTTNVELTIRGEKREHHMLGDITALDGTPWALCTRSILRNALDRLHRLAGARVIAAFEHEFQLKGEAAIDNQAYGHEAFEIHREFGENLVGALASNGIKPDSFMKEYGPNQYEIVIEPQLALQAADSAALLRQMTRSVARHFGETATFTPIRDPASVGNGVHIHMSFIDDDDNPITYDENGAGGMSDITNAFSAGVLKYLPSIIALTAPSLISYARLTPHRWSAAFNNLGYHDREASLRICPVTSKDSASIARQFNIEYRAADAAACPHLALAAIVHAGAQGIEEALTAPAPTTEDLSLLSPEELGAKGFERLPTSLKDALAIFDADETVKGWFDPIFAEVYMAHKAAEIAHVEKNEGIDAFAAYEATY